MPHLVKCTIDLNKEESIVDVRQSVSHDEPSIKYVLTALKIYRPSINLPNVYMSDDKWRLTDDFIMDVKGYLWLFCSSYFLFSVCLACVRVGHHLDCRSQYHIRGLTRDIDTVVVDDYLSPSEFIRHRIMLSDIRVIIWGTKNCYVICQVQTNLWIHSCLCQVCHWFKQMKIFQLKQP